MTKAETKQKFEGKEYPIHVVGRHLDVTDAMKSYAVDKLAKVDRFGVRIIDALITMDVQKGQQSVDFILNINNQKIKVSGRTENMYSAVDQAIDRLESKLRRYVKRIHNHQAKGVSEIEMNVSILGPISAIDDVNDQIEEENLRQIEEELKPHKVVSRKTRRLKTLTHDEVVMAMELSEDRFMVYRGEEDQKLKVIYRRADDNYGVIEVEK